MRALARHMQLPHPQLRHPERSEAGSFLFQQRARPSAVEGPTRFFQPIDVTKPIPSEKSRFAVSRHRRVPLTPRFTSPLTRSFDFGSALRSGCRCLSFAFAQDDGIEKARFTP